MGFLDPRPKNHSTKKLSWKLPDQNRNPSTKKSHQDWLKNNCFTHKKCIRTVSFREIFWGRGVSPFGLKHLRSACGWPWIPRPKIRRPATDPQTTRPKNHPTKKFPRKNTLKKYLKTHISRGPKVVPWFFKNCKKWSGGFSWKVGGRVVFGRVVSKPWKHHW